jgi:RHS repeat-associated protein
MRDYLNAGNTTLGMSITTDAYYYGHDPLGSVTDVSGADGTAHWAYDYEPYGASLLDNALTTTAPSNPMQYTGQYRDSAEGLYHLRARQYQPGVGRFLSQDPIAGSQDALPGQSLYAYANNNPTRYTDPTGLLGWDDLKAAWAGTRDEGIGDLLYTIGEGVTAFGNGASFGLSRRISDALVPGAGCYTDQAVAGFGAANFMGAVATAFTGEMAAVKAFTVLRSHFAARRAAAAAEAS